MRTMLNGRLLAPVIVVSLVIVALTMQPGRTIRPPTALRLATGPEGTMSHRVAMSYVDAINQRGFDIEVIPTLGVVATVDQLRDGTVDAGFVDNVVALYYDTSRITALSAIYPAPLWIFQPVAEDGRQNTTSLRDIVGRVAVGVPDSGTNHIARILMELAEIDMQSIDLYEIPDDEAASRLMDGELDVVFISGGVNSDHIIELLTSSEVEVVNLRRTQALRILIPFVETVTLPEGVVRLRQNIPDETKQLLATQSVLAVHEGTHPDVQRLLLTVAEEKHQPHQWFETPGEYPSTNGLSIPLSQTAVDFHSGDQRLLERYLPFWIASPLERFYLLIFPLLILMYPLIRNSPSFYRNVMNRRINRLYSTVRTVELGIPEFTLDETDEQIAKLRELNKQLASSFKVPTAYMERYYNLRLHIRLVLNELYEHRSDLLAEGQTPPARNDIDRVSRKLL